MWLAAEARHGSGRSVEAAIGEVEVTCRIITDETRTARKGRRCDHCSQAIEIGSVYRYTFSVWEGTPGSFRSHIECDTVAREMWRNRNYCWDEGILLTADVEPEDHEWLLSDHPVVAARLGITAETNSPSAGSRGEQERI